jgi:S1-C subfamily serine protease
MKHEHDILDLLDRYAKGSLTPEELVALEDRMKHDADFRKKALEHAGIVDALRFYGQRKEIRESLDAIHQEVILDPEVTATVAPVKSLSSGNGKRYWPAVGIAASVALISILGTLFMTQSLENKQTAYYKELRRNVEQIQKSQNLIMADMAESKAPASPRPGKYTGTGFLISANGYVATSHHVIKGADSVYIENEKFGLLKTSVAYSDPANDVAILRIENKDFSPVRNVPYTISGDEADLGEDVFTLGFPREDVVFGEGSVSAVTGYRQDSNAYQVSVPVNPGNSGGPLLNEKGELIGIISGIQTETSGAAFAIKSTVLLDAIQHVTPDTLNKPLLLPKQNYLKNLRRVQRVAKCKEFVFMVRVYNQ